MVHPLLLAIREQKQQEQQQNVAQPTQPTAGPAPAPAPGNVAAKPGGTAGASNPLLAAARAMKAQGAGAGTASAPSSTASAPAQASSNPLLAAAKAMKAKEAAASSQPASGTTTASGSGQGSDGGGGAPVNPLIAAARAMKAAALEERRKEEEQKKLQQEEEERAEGGRPRRVPNKLAEECDGHDGAVHSIQIVNNEIFSAGSDGQVIIWDNQTASVRQVVAAHPGVAVHSVFVDREKGRIVTAAADNAVKIFDYRSGNVLHTLEGHTRWVVHATGHEDMVFSASFDNTVRQWDVNTSKCLFVYGGHSDWVSSVLLSENGTRMYTSSWDGTVRAWSVEDWECVMVFDGHEGPVLDMAISGKTLISGSKDKTVRTWHVDDGTTLTVLKGHSHAVTSVATAENFIASGSHDSTVRLWNLDEESSLQTFSGHEDSVLSVIISEGFVFSSSDDYTVRKWSIEGKACVMVYGVVKSVRLSRQQQVEPLRLRRLPPRVRDRNPESGPMGPSSTPSLNLGDYGVANAGTIRSRIQRLLREEENEVICLEDERVRRYNKIRFEFQRERKARSEAGIDTPEGWQEVAEEQAVATVINNFYQERDLLQAVFVDMRERLREDILSQAGCGKEALDTVWSGKVDWLKLAYLSVFEPLTFNTVTARDRVVLGFEESIAGSPRHSSVSKAASPVHETQPESEHPEGIVRDILDSILFTISGQGVLKTDDVRNDGFLSETKETQNADANTTSLESSQALTNTEDSVVADVLEEILDQALAAGITANMVDTEGNSGEEATSAGDGIDTQGNSGQDGANEEATNSVDDDQSEQQTQQIATTEFKDVSSPINLQLEVMYEGPIDGRLCDGPEMKEILSKVDVTKCLSDTQTTLLKSILSRSVTRFDRLENAYGERFFIERMRASDERDKRCQLLSVERLDVDERLRLLKEEEDGVIRLLSLEAKDRNAVVTQVRLEVEALAEDQLALWRLKIKHKIDDQTWEDMQKALSALLSKQQSERGKVIDRYDGQIFDGIMQGIPFEEIEKLRLEKGQSLEEAQNAWDKEMARVLEEFADMPDAVKELLRTIFRRETMVIGSQDAMDAIRAAEAAKKEKEVQEAREAYSKQVQERLEAKRREMEEKAARDQRAQELRRQAAEALKQKLVEERANFEAEIASASEADWKSWDATHFIVNLPRDLRGRPVVILTVRHMPKSPGYDEMKEGYQEMQDSFQRKLALYVAHKLSKIEEKFLFIVDFSGSQDNCRPSLSFLKMAHAVFPYRFRKQLDQLIVIECPFWVRALMWTFKAAHSMQQKAWRKVKFIHNAAELLGIVSLHHHQGYLPKNVLTIQAHQRKGFFALVALLRSYSRVKGMDNPALMIGYVDMVDTARAMDNTDLQELAALDIGGKDLMGRTVITLITKNVPSKRGPAYMDRFLGWVCSEIDELVNLPYAFLLVNVDSTSDNKPANAWLQNTYNRMPYKYKKNLKAVYVIQASFWLKGVSFLAKTFTSSKFWNKVMYIEELVSLARFFDITTIRLPPAVLSSLPFGGSDEDMQGLMKSIQEATERGKQAGMDAIIDWSSLPAHQTPTDDSLQEAYEGFIPKFADINGTELVRYAGRDREDRVVVYIDGRIFKADAGEMACNRCFQAILACLEPVSFGSYAVAILTRGTTNNNRPNIDWMRSVYNTIDNRYRKNMKALYLIQPSFMVKSLVTLVKAFTSAKFWKKVSYIDTASGLLEHFDLSKSGLPEAALMAVDASDIAQGTPSKDLSLSVGGGVASAGDEAWLENRTKDAQQQQQIVEKDSESADLHVNDSVAASEGELLSGDGEVSASDLPQFIRIGGKDIMGRQTIVINGEEMRRENEQYWAACFEFAISVIEQVAHEPYVVIYCNANTTSENRPVLGWIRDSYSRLATSVKKNLKVLYIVHPTVDLRLGFWFARTFVSAKFRKKIKFLEDVADLCEDFVLDDIELPKSTLNFMRNVDRKKALASLVRQARTVEQAKQAQAQSVAAQAGDVEPEVSIAIKADCSRVEPLECIKGGCVLLDGLPLLVVVGCRVPGQAQAGILEELFHIFLRTAHECSLARQDGHFAVLYINSSTSANSKPQFDWLKNQWTRLPRRLRKNVKRVIVHMPNFALKSLTFFTKNFVSDKVWKKVVNCNSDAELATHVDVQAEPMATILKHSTLSAAQLSAVLPKS